jgi:hypothetical protein
MPPGAIHRKSHAQLYEDAAPAACHGIDADAECPIRVQIPGTTLASENDESSRQMRSTLKHIAIKVAGWAFILLGIAGLFLPILQGVLFLLIGLTLLSTEYVWAHNLLGRVHKRYPNLHLQIKKAKNWAARWRHRSRSAGQENGRENNSPGQVQKSNGTEGRDK